MVKRILKWLGLIVAVALIAAGGYAAVQVRGFNTAMAKVYDIPVPSVERSTDPAVVARGKHVAESFGGCATRDCHGSDLSGGHPIVMGPLGTITGPNITPAGRAGAYSDGELARLILHGVKRDGHSVTFMPSQDISWMPDDEIKAVISYLRTVAPVQKPDGKTELGLLAKILDRKGMVIVEVASRIDHAQRPSAPTPTPTAVYGAFMGRLCTGCHGEHLSGGPIPGAPPSIPVPLNITKHETGLKEWTYADFDRLLTQGMRKNGQAINPFMPVEAFGKMNEVEKKALWAYLESVPPAPLGGR
jgi:mono/diheme cytochrome c family protein